MGRWGDEIDEEAKAIEDYKGRFTVNFKKIFIDVDEISNRTLEVTDKHPKDSLLKLWAGTVTGIFIIALFSYRAFALMTVPIFAFYLIALIRVYKCWKSFKYKGLPFIGMSIVAVTAAVALALVIQTAVVNTLF